MTKRTHVTVLLSSSKTSGVDIAHSLADTHPQLVVVLCDAAAPLARHDHPNANLIIDLQSKGVTVLAEDGACARRGIDDQRLGKDIALISVAQVADLLIDTTTKVVWL